MILGEAANHVSKSLKEQHSEIPWADMTGMRHILVHDYFEVDLAEVWKTATADVPPLITLIEQLLASLI